MIIKTQNIKSNPKVVLVLGKFILPNNKQLYLSTGGGESPATATVSGGGERRRTAAAAPAAGPLR